MVRMLAEEYSSPIREACNLVGLSLSTYYYTNQADDSHQLQGDLETVLGKFPRYGTRRATHQLRRPPYGYQINRKRVQRPMSPACRRCRPLRQPRPIWPGWQLNGSVRSTIFRRLLPG